MQRVIFACVHNAGRSQMAAAFLSSLADPAKVEAVSAGTRPGDRVHPEVIDVMGEVGIDEMVEAIRILGETLPAHGFEADAAAASATAREVFEDATAPAR